jgi:hypothetical protein
MGVSLKPSDAIAGGGGLNDADVTITQARFRLWDYNGAIQVPVLGLSIDFETEDGGKANQVYSAGDTKHFVPSDDGRQAIPVGKLEGLNENTNCMAFLASLVNSGFPEDKLGDDISVIEGTKVHIDQVPQPKRPGVSGGDKNKTLGIVTKLLGLPNEGTKAGKAKVSKAATKGQPVAQTQASPATNGAEDPDAIHGETVGHILSILAAKGGSVEKKALSNELFKLVQKDPNRNKIMALGFKDEFLNGAMGEVPFSYNGTTIAME